MRVSYVFKNWNAEKNWSKKCWVQADQPKEEEEEKENVFRGLKIVFLMRLFYSCYHFFLFKWITFRNNPTTISDSVWSVQFSLNLQIKKIKISILNFLFFIVDRVLLLVCRIKIKNWLKNNYIWIFFLIAGILSCIGCCCHCFSCTKRWRYRR